MIDQVEPARIIAGRRRAAAATNSFITFTAEVGTPSVAVKDLIDVAGLPTTAGAPFDRAAIADSDAPVIAHLRAAGAAIVGKTNLYEWAYGVTSTNRAHGDVHNPRDHSRSAGGSSSGSAAAVAAGLCDWAIGTDTAGSVRLPASLCGVVGYKPTHGVISTEGVIPLSPSQDVVGVLAPDVPTAAAAAALLTGEAGLPSHGDSGGRATREFIVPAGWVVDLDAPTSRAWNLIAERLPERELVSREDLFENAATLQAFEAYAVHAEALKADPERFHPDVRARLFSGRRVSAERAAEAVERLKTLAEGIDERLAPNEVLVLPTTACVAPRLDEPDPREPLTRFTRPFSGSGHPAISVPLPVRGLPVGLQLVARRGDDDWLLTTASVVEQRLAAHEGL